MREQPETIGDAILLYVKEQHGTQVNAALAWQCSPTMLSQVIRGTRRPTERMLSAVGYRRVEVWLPRGLGVPSQALPLTPGEYNPDGEPSPNAGVSTSGGQPKQPKGTPIDGGRGSE